MKKTSSTLVISEGKTMTYLIPIVFCGIAALVSFMLFFPFGILLTSICILLGLTEIGLEFNLETMQYRKFKSLFGSAWGKWSKVPDLDSFHLRLSVENTTYRRFVQSTSPSFYGGSSASSKSITYDMMARTKNDQWVIIYEFPSYKMALQLVKKMRELESVEVTDHIALKLEQNQQKRMNKSR
nr:hypothetical protein [uncultured Fluviicola sp.]